MSIFLDSAPVIYAAENVGPYARTIDARLSAPGVAVVVSDLTRLECRVKPLRDGNSGLLMDYDQFFEQVAAEIVGLSRSVIDTATEIRARYGFKTPDAIQLAAAVSSNCDAFLTNDRRLDHFGEIAVEQLESQVADT